MKKFSFKHDKNHVVNKDDLVLQSEEVEKIKWFDIDELYKLIKTTPNEFTPSLVTVLEEKVIESRNNKIR